MTFQKILTTARYYIFYFTALTSALWAQEQGSVRLAYNHYSGQKYHIVAQVDEQVLRNRKVIYRTTILNRIAVSVKAMRGPNALLDVHYQVSEQASNGAFFSRAEERSSQFEMSPQGLYLNIGPRMTLPSLRNVPSFPNRELRVGEGWRAPASEVQDLSLVFGIPTELHFAFIVDYIYRGQKFLQGRKLKHITLFYLINKDVSQQLSQFTNSPYSRRQQDIPRAVRAEHNIDLYWDSERGLPVFQKEDFQISYLLQSGDEIAFSGRSRGKIIEAEPMKRRDIQQELEQGLRDAGIAAELQQNDKGISISIDSINFYPNSERMLAGEERKLQQISKILQKYPNRDILVTGHTANWGSAEQQQTLSENRAATVGQYFIDNQIRNREQIVIRGKGGTEPIASNSNEQGRKRNRRVEITLLEN